MPDIQVDQHAGTSASISRLSETVHLSLSHKLRNGHRDLSILQPCDGRLKMTTKVRITNIVEEGNAHSNGDVVVHGIGAGPLILNPGESHEMWLVHGELPVPLVVTERWPSQAKPK